MMLIRKKSHKTKNSPTDIVPKMIWSLESYRYRPYGDLDICDDDGFKPQSAQQSGELKPADDYDGFKPQSAQQSGELKPADDLNLDTSLNDTELRSSHSTCRIRCQEHVDSDKCKPQLDQGRRANIFVLLKSRTSYSVAHMKSVICEYSSV